MTILNNHLSDDEINALLDNTLTPNRLEHVAQCIDCKVRIQRAADFEASLSQHLFRWDCPSPQTLDAYAFGELSPSETEEMRQHIENCFLCQRDIVVLKDFVNDSSTNMPAASKKPRNLHILATLENSESILRGDHEEVASVYKGEGITIFLEWGIQKESVLVVGQLFLDGETGNDSALITLKEDSLTLFAKVVATEDEFKFIAPLSDKLILYATTPKTLATSIIILDLTK